MAKLEWKRVDDRWDGPPPDGYTYAAQIPGGWLVSVWAGSDKRQAMGGGLTFVPDSTGWKPDFVPDPPKP